jgi:hypothetical protein
VLCHTCWRQQWGSNGAAAMSGSNGTHTHGGQQWDTHILIDMERSDGVGFARTQTKGID